MAKKVRAIPKGYHTITASLAVQDAAKAISFYKKAFGATEIMRMSGPGGSIMHAEMKMSDSAFMIADEMPQMGNKGPKSYGGTPVSFYVYVEDVDAAWKKAIKAGATAVWPLQDMFWGDRTGQLEDPFGHRWSLSQHVRDVDMNEMKKAHKAFSAQMQKPK